jgi:uncharacterized membrane protein
MRTARKFALVSLALFFVAAGANHFVSPGFYVRITLPSLPAPLVLVYISGFFEILGGVGVLVPSVRSAAGWGLILLLIAVFPANLYMAIHPDRFADISPAALYLRLPLQAVFIAWAYWATRPARA